MVLFSRDPQKSACQWLMDILLLLVADSYGQVFRQVPQRTVSLDLTAVLGVKESPCHCHVHLIVSK